MNGTRESKTCNIAFTKELGAKLPDTELEARSYFPQASQIGWNERYIYTT